MANTSTGILLTEFLPRCAMGRLNATASPLGALPRSKGFKNQNPSDGPDTLIVARKMSFEGVQQGTSEC